MSASCGPSSVQKVEEQPEANEQDEFVDVQASQDRVN
jgi:hypothetical protein